MVRQHDRKLVCGGQMKIIVVQWILIKEIKFICNLYVLHIVCVFEFVSKKVEC